jgi:hypothetical protein
MGDADHMARNERMKTQHERAPHKIKKLERIRRFIDVVFVCIFPLLVFKAALFSEAHQNTKSLFLFLAASYSFGAWVFFHLHVNQLMESEETHRRISAVYLYSEELREYTVENTDVLFDAVNQLAQMPEKESLPSPPAVHIQQGDEGKPLGTRERDTLLTIIAALAKEAKLQIDQPGKTALYIEGLTNELGAPVSKRAIEDHLKKIPNALETRMK